MTYQMPREGYYVIQSHQDGASFIGECQSLSEAQTLADQTQARADAAGHWCYQSVSYRERLFYRTTANPTDRIFYELRTAGYDGEPNARPELYVSRLDAEQAARRALDRYDTYAAAVTRTRYNDARPTDRRTADATYEFYVSRSPR